MKINNMERFLPRLMEHLFKQQTLMALMGKVVMIIVEMRLQLQEMVVRDQRTPAMLLRIGVEICPLPRRLSLLLRMEILMPIELSATM